MVDSIKDTHAFNRNLATTAAAIHATGGFDAKEQRELGDRRAKELEERTKLRETEKLLRQKLAQLPSSTQSATLGDLLAFSKQDDEEPEPDCKECGQHFDDEEDKKSCDICDGFVHPSCAESDDNEVVRNGLKVLCY